MYGKEYRCSVKQGEKSPLGRAQKQQEGDAPKHKYKQQDGKQAPEKVKGEKEQMTVNK